MININGLVIIAIFALYVSCNNTSTPHNDYDSAKNFKSIEVKLIDSLGTINLLIPIRYDTSFSWIRYSDCGKSCDKEKYRFQPKELPIFKETGDIMLTGLKDSIDQITISHSRYFPFHNGDSSYKTTMNEMFKNRLRSESNPPIVFDTIQKINDRYFGIVVMEKSDSLYTRKVAAITTIKSNEIEFEYKLLRNKNDSITKNFIQNSINSLKTVQISNGL